MLWYTRQLYRMHLCAAYAEHYLRPLRWRTPCKYKQLRANTSCTGVIHYLLHTEQQEDPREVEAAKHHLNYIGLTGNIGCMGVCYIYHQVQSTPLCVIAYFNV
jgi:hypothetical protein